jgi:thiol-disulfide isomerase/thioredoxin
MKGSKGFLIWMVVLVLLIAGASLLYQNLSQGYQGNLMVQEGKEETAKAQDAVETEEGSEQTGEEPGKAEEEKQELTMAPTFSVADGDGNKVNLTDFYGKPIVVNFWASWCGPCKSEMPDFEEAYLTYGDEINFLMVNMTDGARETTEVAQAYIDSQGYTFPVYFDVDQDAAITYGVTSIPSTFFIDKEGHAVAYAQGAISSEILQTGLDMIYVQE